MPIKTYRDLVAWQKAMDLVVEVYRLTARFPKVEMYGLARQMRDAVVSVPSNTAEGHGRRSRKEFQRYIAIASGSLQELETQLLVSARLSYAAQQEIDVMLAKAFEVGRLLNGLHNSLETPVSV